MDKYFLYDPIEHEFMTFKTQSEQGRTAEELIDSYKGDEWPDGMEDILCGIITEKAKQINVKNRPAKLDEGYGEDGTYWPDDCDYFCDYEMDEI